MKHFSSGARFRTFFLKQPYVPASKFNEGYAYVVSHQKPTKFRENDEFRWVLLDDLRACSASNWTFHDVAGSQHPMNLFSVFFNILKEPSFKAAMQDLP